jgi:hypothetical protein
VACNAVIPIVAHSRRQAQVRVAGGLPVLAISPDRQVLYAGYRTKPAISIAACIEAAARWHNTALRACRKSVPHPLQYGTTALKFGH